MADETPAVTPTLPESITANTEPAPPPTGDESFAEAWAAIEGSEGAAEAPVAPETAEAPEAPKPTDKREQLKALAEELGLRMDDGKVTTRERAQWREQRRKERDDIEAWARQKQTEVEQRTGESARELELARSIKAAHEAGDIDGFAKLLGHKDWADLQSDFVNRLSDPTYKRLRELERYKEEQERVRVEEAARREQQAEQARRGQAINAYKTKLSQTMKESRDKFVREMHDDPWFVDAVFAVQQEHYDGHDTIPAEEAVRIAARGAQKSTYERMKEIRERLNRALAEEEATAAHEEAPSPMRRPAPRTSAVPARSRGSEAGTPFHWDGKDDEEFFQHFRATIDEAATEDRKREIAERRPRR